MNAIPPPAPETPPIWRTIEFVDLHPPGCTCCTFESGQAPEPDPARFIDALNRVARDFLIGLVGAHAIVWVYDALTAGPGLLAMYRL